MRRALAELLGVQDHPAFAQPAAVAAQEAALAAAATARPRRLLIWDNYETVLWRLGSEASDAPFPPEQRHEAAAVQRLVRLLADRGAPMLFTTRQSPVGLPDETLYPAAERGRLLDGLHPRDSERLLRRWISARIPSEPFLRDLAEELGHHPLALRLAAARWDNSQATEQDFLQNLREELAQAGDPAAPMYQQRSLDINLRLSLNALPAGLHADLLALTVIANPVITPQHAAVIWGLETEPAHSRLEELRRRAALLEGIGYDGQRNRAEAYALQPVIAATLGRMAHAADLSAARARYAQWMAQAVDRAYNPEGGIDASPEVAEATRFLLPDIVAALPHLPPERRGWTAWQASSVYERLGQSEQAQRSIELAEADAQALANQELLSRVCHQRASLLVTRGDLDGAMRLYEQALTGLEALGDVRGKSATLVMMAQIQFARGDREQALANARESLRLLQAMGAADAAKVADIIRQMEALLAAGDQPARGQWRLDAKAQRRKGGIRWLQSAVESLRRIIDAKAQRRSDG